MKALSWDGIMFNRMRVYKVSETDNGLNVIADNGDVVVHLSRHRLAQLQADGFMQSESDLFGLNMTLNAIGAIRHGSKLEWLEQAPA